MRHLFLATAALFLAAAALRADDAVARLAFGSCNRDDAPQPLWTAVVAAAPDLWIWTGDIVYADTQDMDLLRAKYAHQKQRPGYRTLLATCPVIGIYDDHDYGVNNGGREFPQRVASQAALLDFLDVPPDSPRRARAGAYGVYTYGRGDRRVRVVLLDTRYHRDPPGPEADILGSQQWAWLETQLGTPAALTVVVSGIQVLPTQHRYEKWDNFPRARRRLLRTLGRTPGVILLSGDRHFAEISRLLADVPYPLYEVTSSGLTHSWASLRDETNRYRVGPFYNQLNFGLLQIDWEARTVALEVRNRDGAVVLSQTVALQDLQP